jgi:hypothetical protein
LDENPESNPDRHSKKDFENNRESEPKRIQQHKIPSEAKTYGKPLNIIEGMEEWTFVQSKCSKKNGKESQGKKKTEEGLMEPKRTGRIRGQIRH